MKYKIIILIFTLIIFSACKLNSMQSDDTFIKISDIENTKHFQGFIKQRPLTKLSFETEGKISFMPYSKGDFVRKGQVLARLDGVIYKIKKEEFNLNNEVNYNIIIAPFDGYIEEIYFKTGSYIKKGEKIIALYPTNKTEAEVLVDARYINKINFNKGASIDFKNTKYEAKIKNVIKNNDDYILELEFENLYPELKKGTNISAKLDLAN